METEANLQRKHDPFYVHNVAQPRMSVVFHFSSAKHDSDEHVSFTGHYTYSVVGRSHEISSLKSRKIILP